jgi:hypothetical protein
MPLRLGDMLQQLAKCCKKSVHTEMCIIWLPKLRDEVKQICFSIVSDMFKSRTETVITKERSKMRPKLIGNGYLGCNDITAN